MQSLRDVNDDTFSWLEITVTAALVK